MKTLLLMLTIITLSFGKCVFNSFGDTTTNIFGDVISVDNKDYGLCPDGEKGYSMNTIRFTKEYIDLYKTDLYSFGCDTILVRDNKTKKIVTIYANDINTDLSGATISKNSGKYKELVDLFTKAKSITIVYYSDFFSGGYESDYASDEYYDDYGETCGNPECDVCYPDGYAEEDDEDYDEEPASTSSEDSYARCTFDMSGFSKVYKKVMK